jgi:hypothetical protein
VHHAPSPLGYEKLLSTCKQLIKILHIDLKKKKKRQKKERVLCYFWKLISLETPSSKLQNERLAFRGCSGEGLHPTRQSLPIWLLAP